MDFLYLICLIVILVASFACLHILSEIRHYREGHDVYDWTKNLVNWIDKNKSGD